jgi:hypothetical protein
MRDLIGKQKKKATDPFLIAFKMEEKISVQEAIKL